MGGNARPVAMEAPKKSGSDLRVVVYIALGALILVLLGLGAAAFLGGSGEPQMVYEGFN